MARVYNQLPSAIPTANDGVRMNDENHFFKEQKSQFEEEDVALSCNHYKRIRHLVSHKRWEHYLSSEKKNEYAWCSLVAWWNRAWHQLACKNCQSTSFLKVTKLSFKMLKKHNFTFSCKNSTKKFLFIIIFKIYDQV